MLKSVAPPPPECPKFTNPLFRVFTLGHVAAQIAQLQRQYPSLKQDSKLNFLYDAIYELYSEHDTNEINFDDVERLYMELINHLRSTAEARAKIIDLMDERRFAIPATLPPNFAAFVSDMEKLFNRDYFDDAKEAATGMIVLGELTDADRIIVSMRNKVEDRVMELIEGSYYADITGEGDDEVANIDETTIDELLALLALNDEALKAAAGQNPDLVGTILLIRGDIRGDYETAPGDPQVRRELAERILTRPRPTLTLVGGGYRKGPKGTPPSTDGGTSSGSTGGDAARTSVLDAA